MKECLPHLLTVTQLHLAVCRHAGGKSKLQKAVCESESFGFSNTLNANTLAGFIKGLIFFFLSDTDAASPDMTSLVHLALSVSTPAKAASPLF